VEENRRRLLQTTKEWEEKEKEMILSSTWSLKNRQIINLIT